MADHLLECFRGLLTEEDHELADLVIQAQRVSQWSYLKVASERSAGWPTAVGVLEWGFRYWWRRQTQTGTP